MITNAGVLNFALGWSHLKENGLECYDSRDLINRHFRDFSRAGILR